MDRPALVAFAQESISRGSKSFRFASRLFDRTTRERVWLLYAWCRKCDDMADGQDHGGAMEAVTDPQARLQVIRELTAMALAGTPTSEPAFDCLGVVARECGLTQRMAEDVIEGFALDAADWHPRSESDLYQYCYHVAGAVGVMMAVVMGVAADDDATLDRACDLGLAFQLANIARDIAEDDAAGRCYLPYDWLAKLDIGPGEHMQPHNREKLALMGHWLADKAENYEASARVGAKHLPLRARWAVLSAAGIYGEIARKVRASGAQAWDQRIFTSRPEKFRWVRRAFIDAVANNPRDMNRDALWTRPS
ncbi:phytoene/squalene synthase family protein [Sphingorhabdus sp. EL138]|uniref:phytoene/squalene synthase family protein n=1 Tax=Sphingorhabdus sp. EL138 TaxID=2073156 RepID=UPI0025EBDCC0|nr:phytoene/squalene synthase family protein [Sphingorhabdus sp. EL138]